MAGTPIVIAANSTVPSSITQLCELIEWSCRLGWTLNKSEMFQAEHNGALVPYFRHSEGLGGDNVYYSSYSVAIPMSTDYISNALNKKPWLYAQAWRDIAIPQGSAFLS